YSGTIAGGEVRPGDTVVVAGSSRTARVARIVTASRDLDRAQLGDAVTLLLGRSYLMKVGTQQTSAAVTALKYQLDVATLSHHAAKTLALNQVGFCNLSTAMPIVFDPYVENRGTGSFILVDRYSGATVAAGTISFALRRASTIQLQATAVTARARAAMKRQRPAILW